MFSKKNTAHLHTVLAVTIILWGMFLRLWDMSLVPFQTDIDELAYAWAGQSYLQLGTPISWSIFGDTGRREYAKVEYPVMGAAPDLTITFFEPWFDHPPLLSILIGAWLTLFGYSFPDMYPSFLLHFPMVVLSAVTLALVYALASKLTNRWAGLLALVLLSFSPAVATIQRMVIGENLYIPLILGAMLLAVRKKHTWWQLGIMAGLLALAGLTKITGLMGLLIVAGYLVTARQYKKAGVVFVSGLGLCAALFGAYVFSIDWHSFWTTTGQQAGRDIGWLNPLFIFKNSGFHNHVVYDAWYYAILVLGLMGLFQVQTDKHPARRLMLIAAAVVVMTNWVSNNEQIILGWYKLPLFVFLAIAASFVVKEKIEENIFLLWVGAVVFLINLGIFHQNENDLPEAGVLRANVAVAFGGYFLLTLYHWRKRALVTCLLGVVVMAALAAQSFYIVDRYYEFRCPEDDCPLPMMTAQSFWIGGGGLPVSEERVVVK